MEKVTHKPLYTRSLNIRAGKKIDKIVKASGLKKWVVVDALLSDKLGIKTKTDLSKYLKK